MLKTDLWMWPVWTRVYTCDALHSTQPRTNPIYWWSSTLQGTSLSLDLRSPIPNARWRENTLLSLRRTHGWLLRRQVSYSIFFLTLVVSMILIFLFPKTLNLIPCARIHVIDGKLLVTGGKGKFLHIISTSNFKRKSDPAC
jgi:hypothetical protein